MQIKSDEDFAKYKGQLRGKIILTSGIRELKADFGGMGVRHSDDELTKMAAAPDPNAPRPAQPAQQQGTPQQTERLQRMMLGLKALNFLLEEGAAVMVDNSFEGSGGTVFVQGANVAQEVPANPMEIFTRRNRLQAYQKGSRGEDAAADGDGDRGL